MAASKDRGSESGEDDSERSRSSYFSQWSQLPSDLLEIITSKVTEVSDYVRLRAVCPSWRRATKPATRIPSQLPWLMLPSSKLDPDNHRSFFSLANNKLYRLHLPEACGGSRKTTICGTPYGWLVMVDTTSPSLSLLNPLTRAQIHLPSLSRLPLAVLPHLPLGEPFTPQKIRHVSLSSDPADKECVIAVAFYDYSKDIAFCKLGDSAWALLDTTLRFGASSVVYLEGRFYAADEIGRCVMIDHAKPKTETVTMIPLPPSIPGMSCTQGFHLVNSAEKLLLVVSWSDSRIAPVSSLYCTSSENNSTSPDEDLIRDYISKNKENGDFILEHIYKSEASIGIFELTSSGGDPQWCEMSDFRDAALFLTENWSPSPSVIYACVDSNSSSNREGCVYYNFHHKNHYSYLHERSVLFVRPIKQDIKGIIHLDPICFEEVSKDAIISETVHCIDILDVGEKTCQLLPCQCEIFLHPSQSLWITPRLYDVGCQPSPDRQHRRAARERRTHTQRRRATRMRKRRC